MSIQTDEFAAGPPVAGRATLDVRVVSGVPASPNEEAIERALRPKGLAEYVGQVKAREQLEIIIGAGPAARSIKLELQPFTLIGATTRAGMLTNPLRDRFGIVARLEFYSAEELAQIVRRSARLLDVPLDGEGGFEIARRSRGTPRVANRLLRRVRDFADMKGDGTITKPLADKALAMLDVDLHGLDVMDRKLLEAVVHRFDGGPVGLDSVAAAIGEERHT